MNKAVLVIIIVILVILGIWYANRPDVVTPTTDDTTIVPGATTTELAATSTTGTVKEFNISAANFAFSLNEIRVKTGDTVKINFTNTEGTHDWKIDEFTAGTKVLKAGESESVQFVANKKGTFEYYCSVGTHRQMGMRGNLIVE